jgi:hypothetical protein
VKSQDHNGARRRNTAPRQPTPPDLAWHYQVALYHRELWRAEVAAAAAKDAGAEPEPPRPVAREPDAAVRARFAQALARAEFGRFYFREQPSSSRQPAPRRRPEGGSSSK